MTPNQIRQRQQAAEARAYLLHVLAVIGAFAFIAAIVAFAR